MDRRWLATALLACACALASAPVGSTRADMLDDDACGKPGVKDCPLQAWMKSNLVAPKSAGDLDKLGKNFSKVPALAPTDSGWADDWKKIAAKGADAASKSDRDAINEACNSCHTKYRKAYREKYRGNPVPN